MASRLEDWLKALMCSFISSSPFQGEVTWNEFLKQVWYNTLIDSTEYGYMLICIIAYSRQCSLRNFTPIVRFGVDIVVKLLFFIIIIDCVLFKTDLGQTFIYSSA